MLSLTSINYNLPSSFAPSSTPDTSTSIFSPDTLPETLPDTLPETLPDTLPKAIDGTALDIPPLNEGLNEGADFLNNVVSNELFWPIVGQVTFGGILGFATGFTLKKAFKVVLIVVGSIFIIIQTGVFFDVVCIDWIRIQEIVNPLLGADSLERSWRSLLAFITTKIPFAGSFIPMFIWGLRKG